VTAPRARPSLAGMTLVHADLVSDEGWVSMVQANPVNGESDHYLWHGGGYLRDAPVDFNATFADNMLICKKPIDVPGFNRNPLRNVPNFTVPRHEHNIDETIIVFQGEYKIEFGDVDNPESVVVKPGNFFTSRAGTPYTMTSGPEGVTYIETWGVPVGRLRTLWYAEGWVPKK
jgi:mannose-6-phosphate isomerase-like protein (cupin superfamily)